MELLEQHEVGVAQAKFKVIAIILTLNRDLLRITRKAIAECIYTPIIES